MSTYISYRLFTISVILLSFFIALAATSFAQTAVNNDTATAEQVRPLQRVQATDSLSDRVAQKRALMQQKNDAAREKFSEDLAQIKDEAKKTIVERISTKLQTMNEAKTTRWANALDTLSQILDRISASINTLKENGVDTSSADTLVLNAQDTIENASTMVAAQAENSYIIEITDETTLRESIQPIVQKFKEDLRATLAAAKSAKDAVRLAARGLAALNTAPAVEESEQTLDLQPDPGNDIMQ